MKQLRTELQYIMMRQEFIAPTFLPVVAESFLRDDFDFAQYLTRGLDRVYGYVFNLTSSALITVVVNICIWAAIKTRLPDDSNVINVLSGILSLSNRPQP